MMTILLRRGLLAAAALVIVLALPLQAQAQAINTVSKGPVGVGSLVLGIGTASAEQLYVAKTTLTNAQVLALGTTAVSVIPAPGAGRTIDVIGVFIGFDYTAAYTGSANLRLYYGDRTSGSAASASITVSGLLVSVTADHYMRVAGTPDLTDLPTSNTAVVLQTQTGVNLGGGNAANSVTVQVIYRVLYTP
jgi:hypothetical protein